MTMKLLSLLVCALLVLGCDEDLAVDSGATADSTLPDEQPSETETVDTTPPHDTDLVWLDPETNLLWQKAPMDHLTWQGSLDYCEALELDGGGDWRLPDIGELKSLVKTCDKLAPCEVSGECTGYTSCWSQACDGCPMAKGDSVMAEELSGGTDGGVYWSATQEEMTPVKNAWIVQFAAGRVEYQDKDWDIYNARCVRLP